MSVIDPIDAIAPDGTAAPRAARSRRAWITAAIVGAATLFVFWRMSPGDVLANTVPTGGDLGAHVWGPAFLSDHLLPLRLSGWAPDWFAGFPAYRFYMIVPALAVAILELVLPYGIALKLVVISGVVAMPVCAWALGKLSGNRFPEPACLAVATLPFLFDTGYAIFGGNIASTLAGEYAYAMSLSLGLLAFGIAARGLATGRHRAILAIVLALSVLCHVIPAFFTAVGILVWLALYAERQRVRWLLGAVLTAMALTAFWVVPFVLGHGWFNDMGWVKTTDIADSLFPSRVLWTLPFAGIAIIAAVARRERLGVFLGIMALAVAATFWFLPEAMLWNSRLLPFWYLCLYLLAGLGIAAIGRGIASYLGGTDGEIVRTVTAIGIAIIFLFGVARPLGALPAWVPGSSVPLDQQSWLAYGAQGSFSGYERHPGWTEYRAFLDTMTEVGEEHGCGRAMWEFSQGLSRYGTTMAPMLLPYWTNGCVGSMEGLYFESSQTTPFHFLNQRRLSEQCSCPQRDLPYSVMDVAVGVGQLQIMGVKYYMASSPSTQLQADETPDLTLVATTGPWKVYEVADSEIVAPLSAMPSVYDGDASWRGVAMEWFENPAAWSTPIAKDGPDDWPRVDHIPATAEAIPQVAISEVEIDRSTIRFEVSDLGTPVVVKVSAGPGWRAHGAEGPWTIAPNLMVIVPTQTDVTLHAGATTPEILGQVITVVGLGGVAYLALAPSRPFRRRSSWWLDDDDPEWEREPEAGPGPAARATGTRPA